MEFKCQCLFEKVYVLCLYHIQYAVPLVCTFMCMQVWANATDVHTHMTHLHACISPWKYLASHIKVDTAFAIETWPFFFVLRL